MTIIIASCPARAPLIGSPKLLVYQLRASGRAEGAPARGWRLLDVGQITLCAVSDSTFAGSRADPSQQHFTWDEIYARVSS